MTASLGALEFEIVGERGVLRFTLRGLPTHALLLRAVAAIVAETKARNVWKVLCDATGLPDAMGAFEKFETGAELARTADPRMKMAVVARSGLVDHIFENVARNHGAVVGVFVNENEARDWLLREETDLQ